MSDIRAIRKIVTGKQAVDGAGMSPGTLFGNLLHGVVQS